MLLTLGLGVNSLLCPEDCPLPHFWSHLTVSGSLTVSAAQLRSLTGTHWMDCVPASHTSLVRAVLSPARLLFACFIVLGLPFLLGSQLIRCAVPFLLIAIHSSEQSTQHKADRK